MNIKESMVKVFWYLNSNYTLKVVIFSSAKRNNLLFIKFKMESESNIDVIPTFDQGKSKSYRINREKY